MPDQCSVPARPVEAMDDPWATGVDRPEQRYPEMLRAVVHYLPQGWEPQRILDLGCGRGHLSDLVIRAFPLAALHVVDRSLTMLEACTDRLPQAREIACEYADIQQVDYAPHSFDLVVSSMAIHHLTHAHKARLFRRIHDWLTPGGVFAYADHCLAATRCVHGRDLAPRRERTTAGNPGESEGQAWTEPRDDGYFPATLMQQMLWLRDAGFGHRVDCTWRHPSWTVLHARKA